MSTATTLTWRTIQRGTRWRDKTGRFLIERRRSTKDGSPVYRTYELQYPNTDNVMLSTMCHWIEYHDSLGDAKAAADARSEVAS